MQLTTLDAADVRWCTTDRLFPQSALQFDCNNPDCQQSAAAVCNGSSSKLLNKSRTRMWADAQRDGRPAEYRWRPLLNAVDQIAKIFAPDKIPLGDKSPRKCIYSVSAQETAKHFAKFGWSPLIDVGAEETTDAEYNDLPY